MVSEMNGVPEEPGWYMIFSEIFQRWECVEVYESVSGLRLRGSGALLSRLADDYRWSEKIEPPGG